MYLSYPTKSAGKLHNIMKRYLLEIYFLKKHNTLNEKFLKRAKHDNAYSTTRVKNSITKSDLPKLLFKKIQTYILYHLNILNGRANPQVFLYYPVSRSQNTSQWIGRSPCLLISLNGWAGPIYVHGIMVFAMYNSRYMYIRVHTFNICIYNLTIVWTMNHIVEDNNSSPFIMVSAQRHTFFMWVWQANLWDPIKLSKKSSKETCLERSAVSLKCALQNYNRLFKTHYRTFAEACIQYSSFVSWPPRRKKLDVFTKLQ